MLKRYAQKISQHLVLTLRPTVLKAHNYIFTVAIVQIKLLKMKFTLLRMLNSNQIVSGFFLMLALVNVNRDLTQTLSSSPGNRIMDKSLKTKSN